MAGNDEGCSGACWPENTAEHFNMGPIPIPWKFREVRREAMEEMPNIQILRTEGVPESCPALPPQQNLKRGFLRVRGWSSDEN